MKRSCTILCLLAVLVLAGSGQAALAQVPARISYQGLVLDNGQALPDGQHRVTFRLYAQDGTQALWTETQTLAIEDGLLSTLIGHHNDLDLPFDRPYFLTVEIEGQQESPPMPLVAAPYALIARDVADSTVVRSISGLQDAVELVAGDGIAILQRDNQLVISADARGGYSPTAPADGVVASVKTAGASGQAPLATLGGGGSNAGLDAAYDESPVITVDGPSVQMTGSTAASGTLLHNTQTGSGSAALLESTAPTNATLVLKNSSTGRIIKAFGGDGGSIELGVENDGTLNLYSAHASQNKTVALTPNGNDDGGQLDLTDGDTGVLGVSLQADGANSGAEMSLFDASSNETVELMADGPNDSGRMRLWRPGTTAPTVVLSAGNSGSLGSFLRQRNAAGDDAITLDADFEGDGRVITDELEIKGGSDLSERFDITEGVGMTAPEAGLVVSIDASHPGRLRVSAGAYDRMVAGVVSGAGGIETGLLMGQAGSVADGAYPVALTGRVYVWVDAAYGAVSPGDLLTTSETAGHAMKVRDYGRAQGAILGKAMTSLEEGRGLVLMLVTLQ